MALTSAPGLAVGDPLAEERNNREGITRGADGHDGSAEEGHPVHSGLEDGEIDVTGGVRHEGRILAHRRMDVSHHADDFPGLSIAAVVIAPRTRKREGRLGEALSDRGLAAAGLARERFADDRDARGAGCVAIGEEAAGQKPEPDDVGVVGN